ncbi:alkaline phosphatase family protein [Mesorhizobium sp.]|uniref:alkaline phosphatase family protein n=1 Tax=Mesorhizobium sp. TaxID=1871066 RepID=UPI000FE9B2F9|nr:alkaline phosphatase family protein [Mesorhizobium sp.]RWG07812.1 MAG: alkaline phosphatase family protein [Mesorhizobium sp.]RWH02877.1 MAG: alkaline phosphatase family protein [Mesorhizobium sp.]TIN44952.1 MAG: alkaline phosphatase family protein [Mesorhizobium sp.]TIR95589.1 MAG: alkaline phosphatase family protein [Mesorhizobium sp.]
MRFLIVSFDGLRPDLVSPELTPNLCRLQSLGITLSRHRTIYPSETRAAFPSLVTGATASRHGMVGNQYVDRWVKPSRFIDTSDAALLRKLDLESGGRLMDVPTLGELLAAAGRSLAVLATNTAGTTRFFHHKAEDFGHIRLSGHFRDACTPDEVLAEAEAVAGPLPTAPLEVEPDKAGQDWITTAFLKLIWPKHRPDVTIISYGEPDNTSHVHGTGAPATLGIVSHCDCQFGRLLDWWEVEGRAEDVQIIAISDHGHVTGHTRVSVVDSLRNAGFRPGAAPARDFDVVVVPGQVGALYLTDPGEDQIARLVEAIAKEPWCGPVFTRPKNEIEGIAPGSLGNHLVFANHRRSADISFSFRADDSVDPFGLIGATFYESDRRGGVGVHGGLHPKELAALGIVAGSAFGRPGSASTIPSGICDLVPTILQVLRISRPGTMTGRVLHEVLDGASTAIPEITQETFEASHGSYRQVLWRVQAGGSTYLEGGIAE